jgi:hypothetical protein
MEKSMIFWQNPFKYRPYKLRWAIGTATGASSLAAHQN